MNRAPAAMYATVIRPTGICGKPSTSVASPPEHLQHPLGDEEATRDVDRRDENRERAEQRGDGELVEAVARVQEATDENDARDRVRDAHERRVQRRGHGPHD